MFVCACSGIGVRKTFLFILETIIDLYCIRFGTRLGNKLQVTRMAEYLGAGMRGKGVEQHFRIINIQEP